MDTAPVSAATPLDAAGLVPAASPDAAIPADAGSNWFAQLVEHLATADAAAPAAADPHHAAARRLARAATRLAAVYDQLTAADPTEPVPVAARGDRISGGHAKTKTAHGDESTRLGGNSKSDPRGLTTDGAAAVLVTGAIVPPPSVVLVHGARPDNQRSPAVATQTEAPIDAAHRPTEAAAEPQPLTPTLAGPAAQIAPVVMPVVAGDAPPSLASLPFQQASGPNGQSVAPALSSTAVPRGSGGVRVSADGTVFGVVDSRTHAGTSASAAATSTRSPAAAAMADAGAASATPPGDATKPTAERIVSEPGTVWSAAGDEAPRVTAPGRAAAAYGEPAVTDHRVSLAAGVQPRHDGPSSDPGAEGRSGKQLRDPVPAAPMMPAAHAADAEAVLARVASGDHARPVAGPAAVATVAAAPTGSSPMASPQPVEAARLVPSAPAENGDLGRQIVQAMRLQWRDGVGDARLTLKPEYLGEVSVSLRVEQGSVTATLSADTPAVRSWIAANEPMLRQSLSDQGLTLGRFVVSDDRAPQDQAGDDGHRRRPSPEPPPEQRSGRRRQTGAFELLM